MACLFFITNHHQDVYRASGIHFNNLGPVSQLQTFRSVTLKERVETLRETWIQQPNGNVAIFTEIIARLFCHAHTDMSEEKKVCFLMYVVKQELFAGLMHNSPKAAEEFLAEASSIKKMLEMYTRQYNRFLMRDC